jgi:hypothetical protein
VKLIEPVIITPRLLPGVKVGDGFVSIEYARRDGRDGRTRFQWYVDLPGGKEFAGDDLQSGCQGGCLQGGLETLLTFLSAAGDAYGFTLRTGRETENSELFPQEVVEWAYQFCEELSWLQMELDESDGLLIEE